MLTGSPDVKVSAAGKAFALAAHQFSSSLGYRQGRLKGQVFEVMNEDGTVSRGRLIDGVRFKPLQGKRGGGRLFFFSLLAEVERFKGPASPEEHFLFHLFQVNAKWINRGQKN